MSLGFYLKVIYKSACEESCVSQWQQHQKVGVSTMPNIRKNPYLVLDFYVQDWHWMASIYNSYPCDLVLSYWILSGYILFWFDFFLMDEMVNLQICRIRWWICESSPCHTSSIWPWSDAPKVPSYGTYVNLYSTYLGGLRQIQSKSFLLKMDLMFMSEAFSMLIAFLGDDRLLDYWCLRHRHQCTDQVL